MGTKTKELTKGAIKSRPKTEKPHLWKVILLNDEVSTIDFVVMLLKVVFGKSHDEANALTYKIHKGTSGVAGIYPKSIAEAKKDEADRLSRKYGFPLQIIIERE